MILNDKTKPQPSLLLPPIVQLPPPAQEEEQKINTENDIVLGLNPKRDLGQLSQNHRKEIASREAKLRKCKADLKQKETRRKRQRKLCENQKCKAQAIEEQTRGKTFEKVARRRKACRQ